MNETCDVNLKFSSSEFWTRQFQFKLILIFIPILIMFISLWKCKEKFFKSKWKLFFSIIIWILISCILVWTWYKISKMCTTRAYINILFIIFIILESIYFYLIFSEYDTRNGKLIIGFMCILSIILFFYVYYIQQTAPMLILIIIVWLFYMFYLTYKKKGDYKCDKCGDILTSEDHNCSLCKKCNKYYSKEHKCKKKKSLF